VATTGESLIRAIKILRKEKIKVRKAVVVVDREEVAKERLSEFGCSLISLYKKSDFFK
jgi:orotate phosphoribosyltransferase